MGGSARRGFVLDVVAGIPWEWLPDNDLLSGNTNLMQVVIGVVMASKSTVKAKMLLAIDTFGRPGTMSIGIHAKR
eukprot:330533-Amphidinium_carterae.1